MKSRKQFVVAMKAARGPVFEIQCDPRGKGCGKSSTGKKAFPERKNG